MLNEVDEQHDVPTVAENEQVQTEQPTSMVTDEEATANGTATDGAPETNGTNGTDATNGDAEKPKELSSEEQQKADVDGKIFLGGLTWQTTDDMLKAHFGKWGTLNDVILMRNKMTGEPRGFGFVQFTETSAADAALKEEHVIDGRTIDVKRAVPRDRAPQPRATADRQSHAGGARAQVGGRHGGMNDAPLNTKIFVGGLDQEVNDADFRAYFAKFGKVEDAVVMYDKKTGRSRGFGFITYDNPDVVRKVMNGGTHELKGKAVEVKPASPRDGPRPGGFNGGGGGYNNGGGGTAEEAGTMVVVATGTGAAATADREATVEVATAVGTVVVTTRVVTDPVAHHRDTEEATGVSKDTEATATAVSRAATATVPVVRIRAHTRRATEDSRDTVRQHKHQHPVRDLNLLLQGTLRVLLPLRDTERKLPVITRVTGSSRATRPVGKQRLPLEGTGRHTVELKQQVMGDMALRRALQGMEALQQQTRVDMERTGEMRPPLAGRTGATGRTEGISMCRKLMYGWGRVLLMDGLSLRTQWWDDVENICWFPTFLFRCQQAFHDFRRLYVPTCLDMSKLIFVSPAGPSFGRP